jgi:methyl-accepting chemotaxis protein
MFGSLTLRWKMLLALFGLSLIPLTGALILVERISERQFNDDLRQRAIEIGNFVEQALALTQRENNSYLELLTRNNDFTNALHHATQTGDGVPMQGAVQGVQQVFNFSLIQVLDPQGNLLLRSLGTNHDIPQQTGAEHPFIQASIGGESQSGLEVFDGRLALLSVAPVYVQQELIGHLIGANFIDDFFAFRIKAVSGAEVAFYQGSKVVAASRPELKELPVAELRAQSSYAVRLDDKPFNVYSTEFDDGQRGVLLGVDRSSMESVISSFRQVLLIIVLVVAVLALLVGLGVSRSIVRPLAEVVRNLREIAEGEGDLTRTLRVESRDEIGELARNFNLFVERLREMVGRTRSVSVGLADATEKIRTSSRQVHQGATKQSEALEESVTAMRGIEASVSGIAESTGNLVDASEESSSATLELGATIEEIAQQMEKLFGTVDEVSSALNEMSVAVQQISENVEILSSSSEVTASSVTELDASIKEIEENADKTNRLSEEAAQDAQRGKEAVEATIEGIIAVRESVEKAGRVIQDLGKQSSEIGQILTVIDEVADQTSLLALNAAIIAAQAGEHGRGFAVVADEIRELAERTAVSTRDISAIIGRLQSGTREAVTAMAAGTERVHQEVERSKTAGHALEKIRASTSKSSEQVRGIVRATQEQARGSKQITNSINQVASMLGQIAAAIRQQHEGVRQLARAAETMKEIASQGKLSTSEQAKGSRQINASLEMVRSMIERIDEATREQTQRSRQVVEAVSSIRGIAEGNAARTAELDQVVELLSTQTRTLEREVGAFQI